MKKCWHWCFTIVYLILIICLIVVSASNKNSFWSVPFGDIIITAVTVAIGYFVAFVLSKKYSDKNIRKDFFIKFIEKLSIAIVDCKSMIIDKSQEDWFDKKLSSLLKTINNKIDLLEEHKTHLINADNELKFIRETFIECKTLATESSLKFKTNVDLRTKATLKLDLISDKLDNIIIKQFD
jgi:uncharacterized membrane protein (DUF485 family)